MDGCFGNTKVRASDLDGIVSHASRHFLVLETKSPNVEVPDGQAILFERQLAAGNYTLFLVWGRNNMPERIVVCREDGSVEDYPEADLETLRRLVAAWWRDQDSYWSTPNPIRNHLERWRERLSRAIVYPNP